MSQRFALVCLPVLLSVTLATAPARAQGWTRYEPSPADARSRSAGHCEIMAARGASAMFANPAWLAEAGYANIQAGGRVRVGTVESPSGTFDEDEKPKYDPQVALANLAFAAPIHIGDRALGLGMGIGYHELYDGQYDLSYTIRTETTYGYERTEYKEKSRTSLSFLTPSAALQIGSLLSVGATYHMSRNADQTYERTWTENENDVLVPRRYATDGRTQAEFATYGAVLRLSDGFRVGGIYRRAFHVYQEHRTETWDNETDILPDRTAVYPAIFGVGVAIRAGRVMTIYGEYQNRRFRDFGVVVDDTTTQWSTMDNGHALRGAFEWQWPQASLRLGGYGESVRYLDPDPESNKPLMKVGGTAGLGLRFGSTHVDVSVDYSYLEIKYGADTETELIEGHGIVDIRLDVRHFFR